MIFHAPNIDMNPSRRFSLSSSGGSGTNAARGAADATLAAGRSTRGRLGERGRALGVKLVRSTSPLSTSKRRDDMSQCMSDGGELVRVVLHCPQ